MIEYEQIARKLAQNSAAIERSCLAIDELQNMMLDGFLLGIDEQIDLAERRIKGGESPAVVFANLRSAMAILRKGL
jgi:hypothetical protein